VADAVFEKPFDHRELLRAIHRLVQSSGREAIDQAPSRATADDRSRVRKKPR
jgi:hypothetical protein